MYRLLTIPQVRELERRAVEEQGFTEKRLMKAAGSALANLCQAEIASRIEEGWDGARPMVAVFVGPGNNGGDGWVAARFLMQAGLGVLVLSTVDPNELHGVAGEVAFEATSNGVHWELIPENPVVENILYSVKGCIYLVDCLLGIGAKLPLREDMAIITSALNAAPIPVISADVPTGVDADTGEADEHAVFAAKTITFLSAKRGLAAFPGYLHTGDVSVASLGLDMSAGLDFIGAPELIPDEEIAAFIPFPSVDANKFTRGRLLIVAGSRRYVGAAVLAATTATRAGAGYVTLAVPESIVAILQTHLITVPIVGLPETREGTVAGRAVSLLYDLMQKADAMLVGPGLGRHEKTDEVIRALVDTAPCAVVIDADGLGAFVGHTELITSSEGSLVLTPHAGELARLLEEDADDITANPLDYVKRLVGERRTVVLKGPNTTISCARRTSIDMFAPPVLATAGTGDVLAGLIAALIAQRVDPYSAACLAVRIHGRSGVIAMEELTPMCVAAYDIIDFIPLAVKSLLSSQERQQND
ncbi:MAG: NAD(P)H-hydrate dehydratase [Coriobacteriia bacterium]|nr:NAD(P)H-hydrate dehydratase [Coriobacteriia bacterium]